MRLLLFSASCTTRRSKFVTNSVSFIPGGWCKAEVVTDITGSVCIEFGNHTYVKALDNGSFTIGPPHPEGKNYNSVIIVYSNILFQALDKDNFLV